MKEIFLTRWAKYFPGAELPFALFYTDEPGDLEVVAPPSRHRCFIADLTKVRNGQPLAFNAESMSCFGGKRYAGFCSRVMPNFEYFLSYGIEGKMEGERYKKTPELVRGFMDRMTVFNAPGKYLVAKRWDALKANDDPYDRRHGRKFPDHAFLGNDPKPHRRVKRKITRLALSYSKSTSM